MTATQIMRKLEIDARRTGKHQSHGDVMCRIVNNQPEYSLKGCKRPNDVIATYLARQAILLRRAG